MVLETSTLNVLDYHNNAKINKIVNTTFNMDYLQFMTLVINKPTRVTRNSTTAIDNIITNSLVYSNVETTIIRTDISDHFQIFIVIKISTNLSKSSAKVSVRECFMN